MMDDDGWWGSDTESRWGAVGQQGNEGSTSTRRQ